MEQAVRLSPRDPNVGFWCGGIGLVRLLQSRTDEAIAARACPISPPARRMSSVVGPPTRAASAAANRLCASTESGSSNL
jgi:hypothetical protein